MINNVFALANCLGANATTIKQKLQNKKTNNNSNNQELEHTKHELK